MRGGKTHPRRIFAAGSVVVGPFDGRSLFEELRIQDGLGVIVGRDPILTSRWLREKEGHYFAVPRYVLVLMALVIVRSRLVARLVICAIPLAIILDSALCFRITV